VVVNEVRNWQVEWRSAFPFHLPLAGCERTNDFVRRRPSGSRP
jgi:hypothetical protein